VKSARLAGSDVSAIFSLYAENNLSISVGAFVSASYVFDAHGAGSEVAALHGTSARVPNEQAGSEVTANTASSA